MKKIILLIISVLLIAGIISAAWWSNDWQRRKEIVIIENSGFNLENYSVRLDITYDNDMQPDFDDLRFVDENSGELEYWIESYTDSTNAIVWVLIPFISASTSKTIYMYYGNPNVNSNSNQDAVCEYGSVNNECAIFFDDFTQSDITNNWEGNTHFFGVNLNDETYLYVTTPTWQYNVINSIKGFNADGTKFTVRQRLSNGWMSSVFAESKFEPIIDAESVYFDSSGGSRILAVIDNIPIVLHQQDYGDGNYYKVEIGLIQDNWKVWVDDNLKSSNILPGSLRSGYFILMGSESQNLAWDYVLLTKYAPVEPSYTIGDEDSDSDGDGVANDIDLCSETLADTEVDINGCSAAQFCNQFNPLGDRKDPKRKSCEEADWKDNEGTVTMASPSNPGHGGGRRDKGPNDCYIEKNANKDIFDDVCMVTSNAN